MPCRSRRLRIAARVAARPSLQDRARRRNRRAHGARPRSRAASSKASAKRHRSNATASRSRASRVLRGARARRRRSLSARSAATTAIPAAARAGLDLALHDLIGKELGEPLYALLGLDPARTPVTSFTIGIADPETTLTQSRRGRRSSDAQSEARAGTPAEQIETIAAIRERYTGTIRIDANEGWNVETAIAILRELAALRDRVLRTADSRRHARSGCARFANASRIPIVTDEDSLVAGDLPRRLIGCVDGVNVKLAKTRRHSRRARDDSHRARDGLEGHARLHG